MKLHSISAGYFKLDGGAMYGVVPKSIWGKLSRPDENNMCSMAMRCLLIEEGERLILVDNGIGEKQDAKFFSHYYLHGEDSLESSLRKKGFSKHDVTDVILTHLHFDHCGGSIERKDGKLIPAFPNALYWSNAKHWEWAVHPNDREKASFLKENILPIQQSGQLQFIDVPKVEDMNNRLSSTRFSDNIDMRFVNGHTESMMLPQIRYKNKTILYMADLLPFIYHMPAPYVMAYDMFPLTTMKEKKYMLEEAYANEYILFFEHDPEVECCTLKETEKGIRHDAILGIHEL
jgi:glyoxylase-like metal-dependent hydrolase (beta-lactamase superfamily II)